MFVANADDIPLVSGNNKIVITATAPDKVTKKVYVINVYKVGENENADLIDIKYTDGGIMTPLFDSDVLNYHLTYKYETDTIDLVPIARIPEITTIKVSTNDPEL